MGKVELTQFALAQLAHLPGVLPYRDALDTLENGDEGHRGAGANRVALASIEEPAPYMGPAARSEGASLLEELVMAREGVGLDGACVAREDLLHVLVRGVGGVAEV